VSFLYSRKDFCGFRLARVCSIRHGDDTKRSPVSSVSNGTRATRNQLRTA